MIIKKLPDKKRQSYCYKKEKKKIEMVENILLPITPPECLIVREYVHTSKIISAIFIPDSSGSIEYFLL